MDEEKCQQCGTPASPGAKYCESCGAPLPGAPPQSPFTAQHEMGQEARREGAPPSAYQPPPYAAPEAGMRYQGVAIRFVAILIDAIILAIITGIVTAPFNTPSSFNVTNTSGVPMVSVVSNPLAAIGAAISALIDFVYFVWLQGAYGQTVGKMAVKQGGSRGRFEDQSCRCSSTHYTRAHRRHPLRHPLPARRNPHLDV